MIKFLWNCWRRVIVYSLDFNGLLVDGDCILYKVKEMMKLFFFGFNKVWGGFEKSKFDFILKVCYIVVYVIMW